MRSAGSLFGMTLKMRKVRTETANSTTAIETRRVRANLAT
jgi:hypothetical protein